MINLLGKIPGVSSAVGFITTKFRLFIEYVMIAAILVLLGTAFTFYIEKLQTDVKLERVTTKAEFLDDANKTNLAAIEELRKQNEKNNLAVLNLAKQNQQIQRSYFMAQQKLNSLEASDEEVNRYLNSTIPGPLQCLLNADCPTSVENANDKGKAP